MIELKREPSDVPAVHAAAQGAALAGRVYAVGADKKPLLRHGKKAVLTTQDGSVEVRTWGKLIDGDPGEGTYLDASDYVKLANTALPKIQRYTWHDTWHKIWSPDGIPLLLSTLAGVLVAAAGIYFAAWADKPTSAATVADRAQTGIEWIVEPADRFDVQPGGQPVADARREVHRRAVQVARCLDRLGGRDAPTAVVPKVSCSPKTPAVYRNSDSAAWVTLAAGLLTAALAVFGLRTSFGFQKSPAG